jgi:hypothetical protein
MAPSLTEAVSEVADQITSKTASLSLRKEAAPVTNDAPAVQTSHHKEPLKLSGALNHFQSFDVTPVIGKEFVGVNLAKWLRAPNSDDLLRDLAITSMYIQNLLDIANKSSLSTRCCVLPKAR